LFIPPLPFPFPLLGGQFGVVVGVGVGVGPGLHGLFGLSLHGFGLHWTPGFGCMSGHVVGVGVGVGVGAGALPQSPVCAGLPRP
jgi:hypothetical protein